MLARGSELWLFNEVQEEERERRLIDAGLDMSKLVNITLVHQVGNAVIRRHLENLPLETFDSVSCIYFSFYLLSIYLCFINFILLTNFEILIGKIVEILSGL